LKKAERKSILENKKPKLLGAWALLGGERGIGFVDLPIIRDD